MKENLSNADEKLIVHPRSQGQINIKEEISRDQLMDELYYLSQHQKIFDVLKSTWHYILAGFENQIAELKEQATIHGDPGMQFQTLPTKSIFIHPKEEPELYYYVYTMLANPGYKIRRTAEHEDIMESVAVKRA